MKTPLSKWFVRHKIVVIVILAIIFVGGLGTWWYKTSYVSKESIEKTSLIAAKQYCNDRHITSACDHLRMTKIEGPQDYGPTDGRDEY